MSLKLTRLICLIFMSIPFVTVAAAPKNIYPLDKGYLLEKNLYPDMLEIQEINPELVKLHILGFSGTEELPIYALEIGYPTAAKNVLMIGTAYRDWETDRKSTRLNSSHITRSRMPSSA